MSEKPSIPFVVWLLFAGCAFSAGTAIWIGLNPPKPQVVTITQTVEKIVPCPPSKTGPATTKGTESPAISGTNNGVTYGQPAAKKP